MSTLVAGPGVSASRREFIVAFYAASDKRDVPAYLEFLAPDVDFRMGLSAMRGHASVAAFRDGMWKGVATRSVRCSPAGIARPLTRSSTRPARCTLRAQMR